ncbi:MAG: hypothetical protein QXK88_09450 [Desulfurococcaceae archaeon]
MESAWDGVSDGKPFVVTCIPAYNEERSIVGVILRTMRYVD